MPLQNNMERYAEIRTLLRRLPSDTSAEVFLSQEVVSNTAKRARLAHECDRAGEVVQHLVWIEQ